MKSLALLALLSPAILHADNASHARPVVAVTGGKVQGNILSPGNVAAFKGIPFAAPPIGDLRWQEPKPVKPWQGVRDASAFSASCVQEVRKENAAEAAGNNEDCLYLNVWSSGWPTTGAKMPVMLWLYGGSNVTGGASADYMDGAALSRKGVVVVSINYRLGVFGFFAHPQLAAESPHHAAGNYGLLDQLAALKWVHANIARFGGDARNVTVFGQSAGSWDTGLLMVSQLSKGLIHRAIQESGPGFPMASLEKSEQQGTAFAATLNSPGSSQLNFLRSLSAEVVQKAAMAAPRHSAPNMGPSVDGWYITVPTPQVYAEGREQKLPLMIGSNAQEMAGPNTDGVKEAVSAAFGINADKAMVFYGIADGGSGNADPLFGGVEKQVAADGRQRCPSVQEAIWHSSHQSPVYEYQFDRPVAGRAATQHSAEVPYVFGNLLSTGVLGGPYTDADRKVSDDLQTYWTNFAKSGNPNASGLPHWPKFDAGSRAYLEFTNDKGPVAKEGLRKEICDLYMENVVHQLSANH